MMMMMMILCGRTPFLEGLGFMVGVLGFESLGLRVEDVGCMKAETEVQTRFNPTWGGRGCSK